MSEIDYNKIYYDKGPLLSHNALFNFVLGARGTGKTYAFKKWALTSEKQCVWVRRYREDIDDLKDKFLTDLVQQGELDGHEVTVDGDTIKLDGETKVFFISLSTSRRKKSQSYYGVDKIIFDEVFEEGKLTKYLKDEVWLLLGLYETVNRLRLEDGRKDARVFLLANKTSFVNPYFAFWGILPFSEPFKKFKNGELLVQNYQNDEFVKLKKESRFGKLIEGTAFAKYAIDNECWLDNNAFIRKREQDSRLLCTIHYNNTYIGLWDGGYSLYCSKAYNLDGRVFAPRYSMVEDERALSSRKEPFTWLMYAYEQSSLFFDNNIIKEYILSILQGDWK